MLNISFGNRKIFKIQFNLKNHPIVTSLPPRVLKKGLILTQRSSGMTNNSVIIFMKFVFVVYEFLALANFKCIDTGFLIFDNLFMCSVVFYNFFKH